METKIHLAVPLEDAQAIANYLQTRPYQEVAGLIQTILRCKPAQPAEPQTEVEEPPKL